MKIRFLKAHKGDCILISFKDENSVPRNILIDGGMSGTYYDSTSGQYGELKKEIDNIRHSNEFIDLLVLTHIDNDHILGLLNWFEIDKDAHKLVKNVWFNSGKLIAEYLNKPQNSDLSVGIKIANTAFTGVPEALDFEDYLIKNKIGDRKIIIQGDTFEAYGMKVYFLSPNELQLKKLLKEYKAKTGEDVYTAAKEKDWNIDLITFIEEEKNPKYKFVQDTSVTNGSSISFILTLKGKNFLFLGDSHPKEIVKELLKFENDGNPLEFEFIKLSHHGSKGNTNKELLEIVKTDNYIISTDSSEHGHPNKRTLARIISVNPNAIFHFNYEYVRNNVFNKQDRIDFKIKSKVTSEFNY